jgi:endonuclease YncB( thermonuclease family)
MLVRVVCVIAAAGLAAVAARAPAASTERGADVVGVTFRVGKVADGDTIDLANGARVRLVQIDTPEFYFHREIACGQGLPGSSAARSPC